MPNLPSSASGYRRFLGIDPGLSGGLACIYPDGNIQWLVMPSSERDLWDWLCRPAHQVSRTMACIEWIHPGIYGIKKSDMAKLYGSYTALRMALTAAGIPFNDVKPKEWQAALGITPKDQGAKTKKRVKSKSGVWADKIMRVGGESTSQWKGRLRAKAQNLYPSLSLWEENKGVQLAVCDSLLLAHYCRQTYGRGH